MDPDQARETHHHLQDTPEPASHLDDSSALDGNAAAGAFMQVLGLDLTMTVVTCATCSLESPFAATRAYILGPGVTVRCPGCSAVLARAVTSTRPMQFSLHGASAWRVPAHAVAGREEPVPRLASAGPAEGVLGNGR